ncbi:MAG: gliding motility protein GldM [Bacteroidia bacterium]
MASSKETPRQKMIGMMYLVLTALLALNVSKDILDAFIVVNNGLEKTNVNFSDRNAELYSMFDLAKTVDPARVTHNWKEAQEAKKGSEELVAFIDKLQKQLIAKTDGVDASVADTIQMANIKSKDNYDAPTNILIGDSEDGSAGASGQLKAKLVAYKTKLNGFVLPADRKKVKIDINTEDPTNTEEHENWEMYNFYHRPLVASLTILTKLQNDVKNAEASTVDYLLRQVDDGMIKFDTIAAKVIPQSNYVLLGEDYKADLFVAAFNKTKNPEVMVGNYNEATKSFEGTPSQVTVEKGLGKYVAPTSREGVVDYSGTIKMITPSGQEKIFPFKSEYIVAKPALTVSAEAMNVVYRGLDNPISVSVPGIPNDRLSVSATNAQLVGKGNGKYLVKPTAEGTVTVSVTATMEDGTKRSMGAQTLRSMRIPKPNPKFGDLTESGNMEKPKIVIQQGLIAQYPSFVYQDKIVPKVTTFKMSVLSGGVAIDGGTANGNLFTPDMKDKMSRLKKNERILFEDIYAVGPDGIKVHLPDMIVKVK